ncbi:MAG TPA: diacylglycerol kinase family protein [Anaerolineales bacterium]
MLPTADETRPDRMRPLRAKLIFNPASGRPDESARQLVEIITHLQHWQIMAEVLLVFPETDVPEAVRQAVRQGFNLVIASGGDGTIDNVAGALVGTTATLGIIPTGTRNNVAYSLGIPSDIQAAVRLLRMGRRNRVDIGRAVCGQNSRWFLEAVSVGLLSALFPAADDIQHGHLERIGDLLSTLVNAPAAEIRLRLDGNRNWITAQGHMVLISNMPYLGAHYQIASNVSFNDNRLDVLIYANLSKLDLIGYAVQATSGIPEDARIQRFQVRRLDVSSEPPLPVMADGFMLGEGPLNVTLRRQGLAVMVGDVSEKQAQPLPIKETTLEAGVHER